MKPKRGDIAVCSLGMLGLITCDEPQKVNYSDGNTGVAWVGIHLSNRKETNVQIGDPWSSRNPKIIRHIDEILTQ